MDGQTRKRFRRVCAHFTDGKHGGQRSTGLGKVATELRCGVWCSRRPGRPSQTRAGGIRHLTLPAGSSQWLGLPRRGCQAGHRKPATEWPHPSWCLSGELTPLKLSVQPYGFIKRLWPGAMPVFPSAFFQHVHTVLSKLNMPRPGGGPGIASS